jgi:TPP-dependent pyruvate/acetoin dehydrogenase alpha subunit
MITSYTRGHEIYFANGWRYRDNNKLITSEERPCIRCGKMPTPEGHDACIGHIDGVLGACCGHGVGMAYYGY